MTCLPIHYLTLRTHLDDVTNRVGQENITDMIGRRRVSRILDSWLVLKPEFDSDTVFHRPVLRSLCRPARSNTQGNAPQLGINLALGSKSALTRVETVPFGDIVLRLSLSSLQITV